MPRIKLLLSAILIILMSACIKEFDPEIDSDAATKYVVSGRVTSTEGWQEVEVTSTANIEKPEYHPVSFCTVTIEDDEGNSFPLTENAPGHYGVWMDKANLQAGTAYRVRVVTPTGEELLSGYDEMPSGPELDSVYYRIEDIIPTSPEQDSRVMQFYVDIDAHGGYSQYYKWEVVETWEYHAAHPAQYYYDGSFHEIIPPDYSKMVCYRTQLVKDVFTVSTKNLANNTYNQYPLHTVDGRTSRLAILYSMLVRQLALSEAAYNYWEQLRVNSNEQGGLYEKQPLAIRGNIVNTRDPSKTVLGYFFAAHESSLRYFYQQVEGITLNFYNNCYEDGLGRGGWREYRPSDYPVYYYFYAGSVRILNYSCIDCRQAGGVFEKPDFWPRERKKAL